MLADALKKLRMGIAILSLAAAATGLACAADPQAPPQELMQWLRQAKKVGVKDSEIKLDALKAGWPPELVDKGIAALQSEAKEAPKPAAPATAAAPAPAKLAPTPAPQTAAARPAAPAAQAATAEKPPSDAEKKRGVPDDYHIGAGDVLNINVWKEPDASVPSVVVRPDGRIAMPLLKEVEVNGLTPREVEQVITERINKFINGADVTVVVTAINSKKIYMIGAIKREGTLPYTYRMTIMQALSEAGGLTEYAKKKKIYVLRSENGKEYRLPFDYDAVLKGERMELNIPLLAGDTIVVPH